MSGTPGLVPQKDDMTNSTLNTGLCSGLDSVMSCTYCHTTVNLHVQMCPEETASLGSCTASGSYFFCSMFCNYP